MSFRPNVHDELTINGLTYRIAEHPAAGQTLASGSRDSTVRLWRVSDSALLRTLEGHTWSVLSVAFSPDGYGRSAAAPLLASGSADGTVRLWGVK